MIAVPRPPKPIILVKNEAHWLADLVALKHRSALKPEIQRAENKYHHREVKDTLVKMFHGKCAYCESKITVVDYGDIEHFYPKSVYVERTFQWSNLLLACSRCNQRKGANFPLDEAGHPLLIDPTDGVTDPNDHLDFVWDEVTKLATAYGRDGRGQTVETIFDLNGVDGRVALLDARSQYVRKLTALLPYARAGNPEALAILRQACESRAEYSAFARVHIQPHLP